MVEALDGSGGARERLWALAAALNAAVMGPGDIGRVSALVDRVYGSEPCLVEVPGELMGALAFVCAELGDAVSRQWLRWVLSARLGKGLVRRWLPGPGLASMHWGGQLVERGFGRETHWISEMPEAFWDRLRDDAGACVSHAVAASDPQTPRWMIEVLAANAGCWDSELLDLLASHPKTPRRVLATLADTSAASEVSQRVAQNLNAGPRLLGAVGATR